MFSQWFFSVKVQKDSFVCFPFAFINSVLLGCCVMELTDLKFKPIFVLSYVLKSEK